MESNRIISLLTNLMKKKSRQMEEPHHIIISISNSLAKYLTPLTKIWKGCSCFLHVSAKELSSMVSTHGEGTNE